MYDGDHLQGRLQLSDEGEEECIKEKMTVRAKQAAVFIHKNSYRNGIVEVRPRILLIKNQALKQRLFQLTILKHSQIEPKCSPKKGKCKGVTIAVDTSNGCKVRIMMI